MRKEAIHHKEKRMNADKKNKMLKKNLAKGEKVRWMKTACVMDHPTRS
jgi:hypothetical protein